MPDSPEPIMPALTAEEWTEFGESKPFFDKLAAGGRPFGLSRRFSDEQKLYALAALALHRHPAVFTQKELGALETAVRFYERRHGAGDLEVASALHSLYQKVTALIPPAGVRIVGSGD